MDYLQYINTLGLDSVIDTKAKNLFEDFKESSPEIKLPEIKSIDITGLYPYKSDHTIMVKNTKANIIYGGNGAGKTTCINSIEFGLLGSSSDLEIKTNFSNRVINKYTIKSILSIDNKTYLLIRSIAPFGESHEVSLQRISETELDRLYETYEGVQEVNTMFHSLTGLTFSEYSKLFDFFSLRVPRRHYLASVLFNVNGAVWRQRIFTKLMGENTVVKISEELFKRWGSSKSSISRTKHQITRYEDLKQLEISQVTQSPTSTSIENETNENELLSIKNKIANIKEQKRNYQQKAEELRTKYFDGLQKEGNNHTTFVEKRLKLDKINEMRENEWNCSVCNSNYSGEATKRINQGLCPACGSKTDVSDYLMSQQSYDSLREEIHSLNIKMKKSEERFIKFKNLLEKIDKEIRAFDRELDASQERLVQLTKETTTITVGRTQDVLFQLEQDLKKFEDEERQYNVLYELTKKFLDDKTNELINKLNERFHYYQRELFDSSKWSLTPSFDILSEDDQEFKHLSHGEKNITDIIFRMSVFDTLKEFNPNHELFFIIDTPEEGLDAAFYKRFQNVFIDFVKNHKNNLIVFTSCEREFIDKLDSKLFRLENLLIKSTNSRPFQVKQLSLLQFVNLE